MSGPDLHYIMGLDHVRKMTQSWLAFSATNIMFRRNGDVALGVRAKAAKAIPEPGDLALIGGFNTDVPGPAMLVDVANAHAKDQVGIELRPDQCSAFHFREFDMREITAPLNTPYGKLAMKRMAFMRIVVLDEGQDQQLKFRTDEDAKIKGVQWMEESVFDELVRNHEQKLSFVHQIDHVKSAFASTYDVLMRRHDYPVWRLW